jgi:hypothetical protein
VVAGERRRRADVAFRAVPVGPGRHEVVFCYASRPIRIGLTWSLAALLIGLGLAVRDLTRATS